MSTAPHPPTTTDPHDQAAQWFTRVRSGTLRDDERRAFDAWRRADPLHEAAYQEMENAWKASAAIPEAALRSIIEQRPAPAAPAAPAHTTRRRLVWGLGLGCAAALAALAVHPEWTSQAPLFQESYATARGERRELLLNDGTVVQMNTGTRLDVSLYAGKRVVDLRSGEAFFTVTHDAERPFFVVTGLARVKVTGTRFNVRSEQDSARIGVEQGSVEVSSGSWWRRAVRLAPGQGLKLDATHGITEPEALDVANWAAWRQGKAVFRGNTLAQIIGEMNRYRDQPLILQAERLRDMRIAGVFSIDDNASFLSVLPQLAPVQLLPQADGSILIRAK
ncbi:FecR family protein [Achromobacter anxifer]